MNIRERFAATMRFELVDRLPAIESYWYWPETLKRWYAEGLPAELTVHADIARYFGLDGHRIFWLAPPTPKPAARERYDSVTRPAMDAYKIPREELAGYIAEQARGDAFLWAMLDGFFWFPRKILGIERHLLAFHDEPEFLHRLCRDVLEFNLRVLEELLTICTPDVLAFGEDMSYNLGPMISPAAFEEFIAPGYRRIVPVLQARGVRVLVDSDGDVARLMPWLLGVGVEGITPLERRAGNDICELRRRHGRMLVMGGFDKTVMHLGESAIRKEFERILPVMRSGGYVPSVDHQTPPEVSLDDYRLYVRLLKEYCREAARR